MVLLAQLLVGPEPNFNRTHILADIIYSIMDASVWTGNYTRRKRQWVQLLVYTPHSPGFQLKVGEGRVCMKNYIAHYNEWHYLYMLRYKFNPYGKKDNSEKLTR